ncbi:MAG: PKD domain-containing protein [Candidatus Bipolaricaulota bacterium]|nr:PKD domain-containing protein [Candidatus Bipolaricaulota bacterium]
MGRISVKILLFSMGLLSLLVTAPNAQQSNTVTVQLVIIMDGSGSISNQDFGTMIEAIARNLENPGVVPRNGTVEFGMVQFSSNLRDRQLGIDGAAVEVPMTVITETSVTTVIQRVRNTLQAGGFTPLVSGIRLATRLVTGDAARAGAIQIFNVITDGNPNLPGGREQAKQAALQARDEAVAAGVDQVDAEGIGDALQEQDFVNFLKTLVWPQPGVLVQNGQFPPKGQNGFVIMARTYTELELALRQKLVFILNQPPVADPGPIPDGKPDTEPYQCNAGQTITLDGSGSFDPNGQITKYEWDFNGDGKPDATGPRVSFTCPTTPGSVTITLTITDDAGATATAQQTITVTQAPPPNRPPLAQCVTVAPEVLVGQTVALDGSGSSDPEGGILTYQWAFITKPTESQAVIEDPSAAVTSFKADKEGVYSVRLTVRDPEGASTSCDVTTTAIRPTPPGPGRDELGAMKRDLIAHGRELQLSKPLEDLRLALSLVDGFGARERARQLVSQTRETVNELLVSLADTRLLMESLAGRAEGVRAQVDAFVETNTLSTERANRIHKAIDVFVAYVEGSSDRLDEIEAMLEEALALLAEAEDSLAGAAGLAVDVDPSEARSPAELIRSARDKLLTAFAQWRALLNGAIARIDKISAQMRAALKLADRRKRFRLVKPQEFVELLEHRVRFAPRELRWSVPRCPGCSLKVTVYGLDGRQITTQESPGPTLALHWARTPANGLYWYVLTITSPDGQQTRLLSKFVLLR